MLAHFHVQDLLSYLLFITIDYHINIWLNTISFSLVDSWDYLLEFILINSIEEAGM